MSMDENMGKLLNKIESSKFKKRPTNKVKKMIRKTLALNELEKAKAAGIRSKISSVFAFLNSGEPKLPLLRDDSDLESELGTKFVQKLAEVPLSILFLPLVAIKVGINAVKLTKWLKQKPELFRGLETQHLLDNIQRFSDEQKEYFKIDSLSAYFDHILDNHSVFPSEYNDLIEGMTEEFKDLQERQAEYDREYDRHL
jgi:hypothetical protein